MPDTTCASDTPSDDSRSFYWYYAERIICGRPVHHQQHATCVRDRGHGEEVACDGFYEPTVEARVEAWRATQSGEQGAS